VADVPNDLERLWTPHRMAYVTGEAKPTTGYDTPSGCPFCAAPQVPPDEGLVVARGQVVYAVLNLYPYNPGHLMVCPYRHVPDYADLDEAETLELAQFTQAAMRVLRRVSGPHGFNIGLNQGHVAGAGIAAHLHQHVVPRWGGDTNFMPVIGKTKVLPQLLTDTRALLAKAWEEDAPAAPAKNRAAPAEKRAAASAKKRAAAPAKKRAGAPAEKRAATSAATSQEASTATSQRAPRRGTKRSSSAG
jgi:ATP adenylyltransferase